MILNLSAGDNTSEEVNTLLLEFMSEVNDTLTAFKSEVNTMLTKFTNDVDSDITALNTKFTSLTSTVNSLPKSAVKSIQRGVIETNTEDNKVITITTVNPNKCLVLLNTSGIAGTNYTDHATLVSLTATTLTIKGGAISGADTLLTTSWQVVEFY
jgi:NAD-specific glutamate dehydrogenase